VVLVLAQNAAIAADGAAVRIAAHRDADDAVVITVEDDGPGVPLELEATLFAAFVTGRGRDHRHPGTGLGLAIARRIAERHGGTLVHQRPPEGGARFVLRLPRGGTRS
jgi:signal transduction histidine kinase